jgi:hypothetical protein
MPSATLILSVGPLFLATGLSSRPTDLPLVLGVGQGLSGAHLAGPQAILRLGLGFGSLPTARRTLAGYEVMAMMRKGQVRNIGGRDIQTRATFIAGLFQVAA